MNVLVIGANGFLGPAIADAASARSLRVIGVSRSTRPVREFPGTYLAGDRKDADAIADMVRRERIDAVVDVIAMTLADTAPLLAVLDGRIRQYVLLSSCDVYRNYELLHRKAGGTPEPGPLDERAALRTSRYPYRGTSGMDPALETYDKIPIEQAVERLTSR